MITIRNFERVFIANQKRRVSRMDYKKEIFRLLETMNDSKIYKFIYDFLITIKENW